MAQAYNQNYYPGYYPGAPSYQPQVVQGPYQDRLMQLQNQYQNTMPQMPVQAPPQTNQGLLWVQGEAGAKSYLVAPNTTVLLMDSEAQRFYLKSTDGAGMPSLRTYEYAEIFQNQPAATKTQDENLDSKYVTRAEYDNLQRQYAEILDRLSTFPGSVPDSQPAKKTEARNTNARNKGGNDNE